MKINHSTLDLALFFLHNRTYLHRRQKWEKRKKSITHVTGKRRSFESHTKCYTFLKRYFLWLWHTFYTGLFDLIEKKYDKECPMRCFSQKPIICVHAVIRPGRSCMSILNRYSQERHFFQDSFSKDRMANRWVEAKICSFKKAHFVIFSRRQRLIYPQNCNGFTSFDASLFGSYVTLVRSLVMFWVRAPWLNQEQSYVFFALLSDVRFRHDHILLDW